MNQSVRHLLQACSLVSLGAVAMAASAQTPPPPPPSAPAPVPPPAELSKEDGSYLTGVSLGQQLQPLGITSELSVDEIVRGLKDGLGNRKLEPMDQRNLQAFIHAKVTALAERNKAAGRAFLERNGHEKGVKTTASGLEYKIVSVGDAKAASPGPTDQVTVQYRGTLLDGTEFDSSYTRGQPATFPVNGVIKGWTEALQLMKPGAKWKLWIPQDLAYGDQRPRPGIPVGSMLTFDVELLSVKPAPAPPPAPPTMGPGSTMVPPPSAPPAPPTPPAAK